MSKVKTIARAARGRKRGIYGRSQKIGRKNKFPTQDANHKLIFPSVCENQTKKDGQEIH